MAKKIDVPPRLPPAPVRMGDPLIYVGAGGVRNAAIATSDQAEGDGKLCITCFPVGMAPMAMTWVQEDAEGKRNFSWHRRG